MPVEVGECVLLWGACWWDALAALGTVAAVVVSLGLAAGAWTKASREAKRAGVREAESKARMVSAWIESEVDPSPGGERYVRHARLLLSNQSEQPVFNVDLKVGLPQSDGSWLMLGSLAAPTPIRVLAPHGIRSWDVTLALMTYGDYFSELSGDLAVSIGFEDPSGTRWSRDVEQGLRHGGLTEGRSALRAIDPDSAEAGPENPENPIFVVRTFFEALFATDDPDIRLILTRDLLDPGAGGWLSLSTDDLATIAEEYSDYGVAISVQYPAPRIAYVRLVRQQDADTRIEPPAKYVDVRFNVVTLRYRLGHGWRIFSIGRHTPVDRIAFPERDLHKDVMERDPNGTQSAERGPA